MKVAILAGGAGTRFGEETAFRPKPMIEIGGQPILWHIMMHYATHGFAEFAIALGYRGDVIKNYIVEKSQLAGSLSVDFRRRSVEQIPSETLENNWRVDLIETGQTTATGGRLKRLAPYVGESTFMLTFGDGLSNVNIKELLAFHRSHGRLATMTGVRPPGRFGHIRFSEDGHVSFEEKPAKQDAWISGGFFVFEPGVFDYVDGDSSDLSSDVLTGLAADGELQIFRHESFWQCMDTQQERKLLEELWHSGCAPWKTW